MATFGIDSFDSQSDDLDVFTTSSTKTVDNTDGAAPGGAITYRMRGFDTHGSVNNWVHWTANEIDGDASEYTGSAGPVTRISLVKEIGI